MWHRLVSQLRKLSSFPSRRRLQLRREILHQQYQYLFQQALVQRPIENWSQSVHSYHNHFAMWTNPPDNPVDQVPEPERETFPGSIIGYRCWNVISTEGAVFLGPVGVPHMPRWQPGWNTSRCANRWVAPPGNPPWGSRHESPQRDCACGFWSFYRNNAPFSREFVVGGVIEGAGRVVLHTEGFRAERARIKALFPVSPGWVASGAAGPSLLDLGINYQVPVLCDVQAAEELFPPTNPKDFGVEERPWRGLRREQIDLGTFPLRLTTEQMAEFSAAFAKLLKEKKADG